MAMGTRSLRSCAVGTVFFFSLMAADALAQTPSPDPSELPDVVPSESPAPEADEAGKPEKTKPDKPNPKGNNGTIKVDAIDFDDHPNNEPHVGCVFQIDFYNFDQGRLSATYIFDNLDPTGSGEIQRGTVGIGQDPAGGGRDLDASVTVDLTDALAATDAEPHPQQGFHVKLTVHADGSIGADVKHKVFWIEECSDDVQEARVLAAGVAAGGSQSSVAASGVAAGGPGGKVAAERLIRGGRAAARGGRLPFTGIGGLAFAALGTWLVVAGASLQGVRPRSRADQRHQDAPGGPEASV
jgi:hypothetical protein